MLKQMHQIIASRENYT